jgi:cytochrome c556
MRSDQLRWQQFIALRSIGRAFLFGILLMFAGLGSVQAQQSESKITLRAIMQELGVEYLRLTNALLIDNFKDLEESAKAIQRHPLPAEIAAAIKSKLGKNFRAFERIDEQSHRAAGRLATRAMAKDASGAAKALGPLAESCVSCHKQFRATLRSLSD